MAASPCFVAASPAAHNLTTSPRNRSQTHPQGAAADAPLSAVAWGPSRRPRSAPRPHLCLVSHLASRQPSATFLLRSYSYGETGAEARLFGEDGLTLLDSVRATSAAPWYMEEICMQKARIRFRFLSRRGRFLSRPGDVPRCRPAAA